MKETKEWEMIAELKEGYESNEFDLHDDHLSFIVELHENLDPYMPMIDQKSDKEIKLLHWLYDWKLNHNYVPFDEYE